MELKDNHYYIIQVGYHEPEPAKYNAVQEMFYTTDGGFYQEHTVKVISELIMPDF